ncbi:DUF6090 family protein [Ichthyenterobacterium sp. W332]|uniref:DUF6090 family protein n=1 Tax=Microcosmobacter mediterraneus TaxID=3075607 RepID=A0ABU2YKP1_9FLAO|nr:DUF6090 family protein [Ichthyenterobacterium sp. W332]MDT0558254.1 DUF6090 family protein [Ichthyenterobacterium sp. W332]
MIKFFRQIRYKLMSDNKMGKYFKYAIGEILLVVIGILIALQVNNWNNSRLDQKLESDYSDRIIEDLKEEEAILNAVLSYNKQVLFHAKNAVKVFENSPNQNNNPLEVLIDMYQASQLQDPNSAMSTYQELIASGQINLIQNETFKTAIIRYYEADWTETEVMKIPNNYRTNLRGKMPDDVQSEIRANCDDIYIKIRESIEVALPENCTISLETNYALQVVNQLKADSSLKKDLRFLIGNVEAKLKSINSSKDMLQNILSTFNIDSND